MNLVLVTLCQGSGGTWWCHCSWPSCSALMETALDHALSAPLFCRQVKDQNKKVANLKHKEQVEKKKSAQMLEEARRREDNLNDSSQQLQVTWELINAVGIMSQAELPGSLLYLLICFHSCNLTTLFLIDWKDTSLLQHFKESSLSQLPSYFPQFS